MLNSSSYFSYCYLVKKTTPFRFSSACISKQNLHGVTHFVGFVASLQAKNSYLEVLKKIINSINILFASIDCFHISPHTHNQQSYLRENQCYIHIFKMSEKVSIDKLYQSENYKYLIILVLTSWKVWGHLPSEPRKCVWPKDKFLISLSQGNIFFHSVIFKVRFMVHVKCDMLYPSQGFTY